MANLSANDFDYDLPPELIAREPAKDRAGSRLLVVGADDVRHHHFHEIGDLLEAHVGPRPLLVLNDTKVIPARLYGHKLQREDGALGGRVELLLCEPVAADYKNHAPGRYRERWRCLYRSGKPLRAGTSLLLSGESPPSADVIENEGGGRVLVDFSGDEREGLLGALGRLGEIPLPPYILTARRQAGTATDAAQDRERYQTVYARHPGSVAAPTAGLHFSPALLERLRARGIDQAHVTLHVGPGTFAPLSDDDPAKAVLHEERYEIPAEAAAQIRAAKEAGRKIVAVGTTVVRTLEGATSPGAHAPEPGAGHTRLFIYPPYRFQVVDAMITNFHLPRSSLLMLVAALAGRRRTLAAYQAAVAAGYRFYSFGDAMLIPAALPEDDA